MSMGNEKQLLEFIAYKFNFYNHEYRLYVKDGKPIRIMRETEYTSNTIYPEDSDFHMEWCVVI